MRYAQQVTAFPAGITTGSTWDTSLMYARGYALGMLNYHKKVWFQWLTQDFRSRIKSTRSSRTIRSRRWTTWKDPSCTKFSKKSIQNWYSKQGGRNWEGFSNDPYLSGVAMANVRTPPTDLLPFWLVSADYQRHASSWCTGVREALQSVLTPNQTPPRTDNCQLEMNRNSTATLKVQILMIALIMR